MRRNRKKIIIYSVLTFAVMLMIFFFSAQNGDVSGNMSSSFIMTVLGQFLEKILPPITGNGFEADIREYAHMFEYWCLGISLSLLLREVFVVKRWLAYPLAEVGCFLYACTDEFHQTFVPDRVGTFADVGVDAVGFTIGVLFILIAYMIINKKEKKRDNNIIKNEQ